MQKIQTKRTGGKTKMTEIIKIDDKAFIIIVDSDNQSFLIKLKEALNKIKGVEFIVIPKTY
jgi:uncharacterized protein YebE (UPF0316 family)